jgi:luciferase family oxidoreductase group 1
MPRPVSLLDLAIVGRGESTRDALRGTVAFAQRAEILGYRRVWYAEHHNMPVIASSAPAVLIAHVAAHTRSIRLGAGGVMLPNHAPLTIAEQFGTLAELHPGRIELGLGRAPGTDQVTLRALRRDATAADTFPDDIRELQGYLKDRSVVPTVNATPGRGTDIPLYILGSSLYGAQLAAALGLPYAFASHFAPQALHRALSLYRERFKPSPDLDRPYAMVAVNVFAADTEVEAREQLKIVSRVRAALLLAGRDLSDEEADQLLASPRGRAVADMLRYTALGPPDAVRAYLEALRVETGADELILCHGAPTLQGRLRSLDLAADALGLV